MDNSKLRFAFSNISGFPQRMLSCCVDKTSHMGTQLMVRNDDRAGCGTDQTRRLTVGDDVVHEDGEVSVMVPQSSQALERPVVFQLALSNS